MTCYHIHSHDHNSLHVLSLCFGFACHNNLLFDIEMQVVPANCSDGDVRLVDGSVSHEGRVEVCINQVWGTICSSTSRYYYNYWDVSDAKVVCRQLGHQELGSYNNYYVHNWINTPDIVNKCQFLLTGASVYTLSSTFGSGLDPIYLSNIGCSGSETDLLHCPHSNYIQLASSTYCTHNRDVGLKCQRMVILNKVSYFQIGYVPCSIFPALCLHQAVRVVTSSDNLNSSFGRVEVCVNGTWGTICSDFWGNEDASVVCKQLGYSEYGKHSNKVFGLSPSRRNLL